MDSRLEKLKRAIDSAANGMSVEQLNWHTAGKWCAAEVLEHLYLTYTGTIKGFDRVMQAGKPLATRATIKQRWQTLVVVGFNYLPSGRSAPETTVPRGLSTEKVRAEVAAKIEAMDAVIGQCEARFGRSVPLLDHPIIGPLTAAQWRKFHLLHGLHHEKQILLLREAAKQSR